MPQYQQVPLTNTLSDDDLLLFWKTNFGKNRNITFEDFFNVITGKVSTLNYDDALALYNQAISASEDAEEYRDEAEQFRDQAQEIAGYNDPQDAKSVLAGPVDGSASTPTFRELVRSDIPEISTAIETSNSAPQLQKFRALFDSNNRDVNLIVYGDSTGNESNEWVYLMSEWLASQDSRWTVNYRLWNDATNQYGTPTVIQEGSGPNTLYIYNASVSGTACSYFSGFRREASIDGKVFDLIIANYGHNQGSSLSENSIWSVFIEFGSQLLSSHSQAGIVFTLQNIATSQIEFCARTQEAVRRAANQFGFGIIDVYSKWLDFVRDGTVDQYMSDSVHPNALGSQVWASIVTDGLIPEKKKNPVQQTCWESKPNYLNNPYFEDWQSGPVPSGWTVVGGILSRDTSDKETLQHSLRFTGTAATSYMQQDLDLGFFRGPCVVFARIKSSGAATVGRIALYVNNVLSVDGGATSAKHGAWVWVVLAVRNVSVNATSAYIRIFSNTDQTVLIDRIGFCRGSVPGEIPWDGMRQDVGEVMFNTDYGHPSGYGGVVTQPNENTIRQTSSTGSGTRLCLNLRRLTIGDTYSLSWVDDEGGSVTAQVRSAINGGGGNVGSSVSASSGNVSFVATATSMSLMFASSSSGLTLQYSSLLGEKVGARLLRLKPTSGRDYVRRLPVPSSSSDAGVSGDTASDSTYFYWHDGSSWNRVEKGAW